MENQKNRAELVITKEFDAPREIVFNAFADGEALAQWWGPAGIPVTVVKFDFKPEGIFLYKAEMHGQTMWGRFIYKQINRPELLEFISSFSDKDGGITRAPFSDKFPLEILNRFEFSEKNKKTIITLKGYPVNASEEEVNMYIQATAGIQQGLEGTFAQLANFLALTYKP